MKLFLRRILLFFSSIVLIVAIVFGSLNYFNNNKLDSFKINKSISSLFVGDSHVQMAVNDKVFTSGINIANKSEAFYYSYFKIKTILKQNPNIDKVYLGFSYHSLSSYYDEMVYGKYSKDIASKYFFVLPLSEKIKMIECNKSDMSVFVKNVLKFGATNLYCQPSQISFLGCYENNFKNSSAIDSSMNKRIEFQFYSNGKLEKFSDFNLSYLTKIIELCHSANVELIVLNTPLNPSYKNKIPKEYIEKYNQIIKLYNLEIVNYDQLSLGENCYIPDGDHVSEKGALLFSKFIYGKH